MSDDVIVFVAGQLGVDAADLGFYEWSGSTIEYHRAQIRDHLGYRVATVADQERLTGWLSEAVAHAERRPDRVREELLAEFRRLRIEPPTAGRILRMVRLALRTAEQNWASRIAGLIKASPGNVSLESMMTEIGKLQTVRALDLPAGPPTSWSTRSRR